MLETVRENPDDDAPRLILSDWIEECDDPDRAEFIRIQIEAEKHRVRSPDHTRLNERAIELLRRNIRQWSNGYEIQMPPDVEVNFYGANGRYRHGIMAVKTEKTTELNHSNKLGSVLLFRRGFVDEIDLTSLQFCQLESIDIQPTGPLPILNLRLHHPHDILSETLSNFVGRLASSPMLQRFREISLVGGFGGTSEEGIRLLTKEPALLEKLAGLSLSEDHIGDQALLQILESPVVTKLRKLQIDDTGCTSAIVDILVRSKRFRGMNSLNLEGIFEDGRGIRTFAVPGLWPRLQYLHLGGCGLEDMSLKGLMRPGTFPSVELLDLAHSNIQAQSIRELLMSGALPSLRMLGIGGTPLSLDDVWALRAEFGHCIQFYFPIRGSQIDPTAEAPGPLGRLN